MHGGELHFFHLLFIYVICMLTTHFTKLVRPNFQVHQIDRHYFTVPRLPEGLIIDYIYVYIYVCVRVCVYTLHLLSMYSCVCAALCDCLCVCLGDGTRRLTYTGLELQHPLSAMDRPIWHGCRAKATWLLCCTAILPHTSSYWYQCQLHMKIFLKISRGVTKCLPLVTNLEYFSVFTVFLSSH